MSMANPVANMMGEDDSVSEAQSLELERMKERMEELESRRELDQVEAQRAAAEILTLYDECDRLKALSGPALSRAPPPSMAGPSMVTTQEGMAELRVEVARLEAALEEQSALFEKSEAEKEILQTSLDAHSKPGKSSPRAKTSNNEAIMKEAMAQACVDRDRFKKALKKSETQHKNLAQERDELQQRQEALEVQLANIKFEVAQVTAENEDLRWDLKEAASSGKKSSGGGGEPGVGGNREAGGWFS